MAEWAMVVITFVYVVATILICIFNYRSVKVAKDQIELSKLQYEDNTRLKLMPCLYVERIASRDFVNGTIEYTFSDSDSDNVDRVSGDFYFRIVNVGSGIAKNVHYYMDSGGNGFKRYGIPSFTVNDYRTVSFYLKVNVEQITN